MGWRRRHWQQTVWTGEEPPRGGQLRGRHHVWAVVDLRRGLVGWLVTEQLGPACRRRRYLHLGSARPAFLRGVNTVREHMQSLVGLSGWVSKQGDERRYELQR